MRCYKLKEIGKQFAKNKFLFHFLVMTRFLFGKEFSMNRTIRIGILAALSACSLVNIGGRKPTSLILYLLQRSVSKTVIWIHRRRWKLWKEKTLKRAEQAAHLKFSALPWELLPAHSFLMASVWVP